MNDLKEEILCRLQYYRQLCSNIDIPVNLVDYYRGCADSLNSLLFYMENGINENSVEDSDLAKKIDECKMEKSRFISEALKK